MRMRGCVRKRTELSFELRGCKQLEMTGGTNMLWGCFRNRIELSFELMVVQI